jgi:hypothetical protein
MSCARHSDAILEHALGEPATLELQAHLGGCDGCRAALERERRLVGRIDGELREALEVSPGPALLPRVRERAASETERRPAWGMRWLIPVAAGAAALAMTAWLLRATPVPQAPQTVRVEPRRESPAPPVTLTEASPRARTVARAKPPKALAAVRPAAPEVLVPAAEEAALLRFVATIRAGRVDMTAIVREDAPPPPDLGIAPLTELPSLDVKPLTAESIPEGVIQ